MRSYRTKWGVVLLLLLLALSGCFDPFRRPVQYPPGPDATLKWSVSTLQGSRTEVTRAAAAADGLVFFIANSACLDRAPGKYMAFCLYAVDEASGNVQWQLGYSGSDTTDVVASDGLLYFGATLGSPIVFAVDPHSGAEKWEVALGGGDLDRIIVQGDTLYVSASRLGTVAASYQSDVLYALDKATGDQRWRFDVKSPDMLRFSADAAQLYLGYRDVAGTGYVKALDTMTGQENWRIQRPDIINGDPVPDNGQLYVPGNLAFYVFDASTGTEAWRYTINDDSVGPLAVDANNIYYDSCSPSQEPYVFHCKLIALTKQTRQPVWTLTTESNFSAPVLHNGVIYLAISHGIVYAVEPANGAVKWRYETGNTISARVALSEQNLFVGNWWLGTLYAIPLDGAIKH